MSVIWGLSLTRDIYAINASTGTVIDSFNFGDTSTVPRGIDYNPETNELVVIANIVNESSSVIDRRLYFISKSGSTNNEISVDEHVGLGARGSLVVASSGDVWVHGTVSGSPYFWKFSSSGDFIQAYYQETNEHIGVDTASVRPFGWLFREGSFWGNDKTWDLSFTQFKWRLHQFDFGVYAEWPDDPYYHVKNSVILDNQFQDGGTRDGAASFGITWDRENFRVLDIMDSGSPKIWRVSPSGSIIDLIEPDLSGNDIDFMGFEFIPAPMQSSSVASRQRTIFV